MLPKQGYSIIFSPTKMSPVFTATAFTRVTTWAARLPAFRSVFNRLRLDRFFWSIEPFAATSVNKITNRVAPDAQPNDRAAGVMNNTVFNQHEQKVQQDNQYHQHWHNQHNQYRQTVYHYNVYQERGSVAAAGKKLNQWHHSALVRLQPNSGFSVLQTKPLSEQNITSEANREFSPVNSCLWSNDPLKVRPKIFSKILPNKTLNKVLENEASTNKTTTVSSREVTIQHQKIVISKNQTILWPAQRASQTVCQDVHSRSYHGHNQNKTDNKKTTQRLNLGMNTLLNRKGHYALNNQSNPLAGYLKGTSTALKNMYQSSTHGTLILSKPNDGPSIFETIIKTKCLTALAPKASLARYTKVIKTLQKTHSKIQPFAIVNNIQKNDNIQRNNIKSRYQRPKQSEHIQVNINKSRVFQPQSEWSITEEESREANPVDSYLWTSKVLNKSPKNKAETVSPVTQIKQYEEFYDTKNQSILWPVHSAYQAVYQDAYSSNYHRHNQNKIDSTKIDSTKTDKRLSLGLNVLSNSKGHYALANQSNALAGYLKGTSSTLKNKYQPLSYAGVAPKMLMQHLLDRTQPLPWAIHNDTQLEKKQVSFFPHNMNSVGAHKASDSERDSENNLHALKDEVADLKHTLVQWQETLQAQQQQAQQLQQQSQQHLQTLVSSVSQPKQTIRSMNHRPVHAPSFFDPL